MVGIKRSDFEQTEFLAIIVEESEHLWWLDIFGLAHYYTTIKFYHREQFI